MTSTAKPKKGTAAADPIQLPVVIDDGIKIAPDDVCARAQTPPERMSLEEYADAINASWNRSVEGILEASRLCANVRKDYDKHSLRDFIDGLTFDRTVFSKLADIGDSETLKDTEVRKNLPPSWTIMDLARRLSKNEARRAISAGTLYISCSRAGLKGWMSDPGNCQYGKALQLKRRTTESNRRSAEAAALENTVASQSSEDPELDSLVAAFFSSPDLVDKWRRASEPVRHRFWFAIKAAV